MLNLDAIAAGWAAVPLAPWIQSRKTAVVAVALITHSRTSLAHMRTRLRPHRFSAHQQRRTSVPASSCTDADCGEHVDKGTACGTNWCPRLRETG
jgi:hypothetical protein